MDLESLQWNTMYKSPISHVILKTHNFQNYFAFLSTESVLFFDLEEILSAEQCCYKQPYNPLNILYPSQTHFHSNKVL